MTLINPAAIKVEPDRRVKVEVELSQPVFASEIKREPYSIKQEYTTIKQESLSQIKLESGSSSVSATANKPASNNKPETYVSKKRRHNFRYQPYRRYIPPYYNNNNYNQNYNYYNQGNSYYNQNNGYYNQNNGYYNCNSNYNSYNGNNRYRNTSSYQQATSRQYPSSNQSGYRNSQSYQRSQATKECNTTRRSVASQNQSNNDCIIVESSPEIVDLTVEKLDQSEMNWKRNSLFKIGIWDTSSMPTDRLAKLKHFLVTAILNDNNNSTVPRFYDCIEHKGWLQISCKDRQSRQWFSKVVPKLKPWPQAQLRTKDCDYVENYLIATVTVSKTYAKTVQELVALLKKQNRLSADKWRITNTFNDSEAEFLKVDFTLTEGQLIELRKLDFNPTVGFGKAVVQLNL